MHYLTRKKLSLYLIKIINMHIQIIDDDDRLRQLLKLFLKKNNFKVSISSNAIKAKKILNEFVFDLIVLDVMMPGKSGIDFLNELRLKFNTPVLLLTALDQIQDKITGFESGADDYLTKPFSIDELLVRIKAIQKRLPKKEVIELVDEFKFASFIALSSSKSLFIISSKDSPDKTCSNFCSVKFIL